jgi:hypothetical protein
MHAITHYYCYCHSETVGQLPICGRTEEKQAILSSLCRQGVLLFHAQQVLWNALCYYTIVTHFVSWNISFYSLFILLNCTSCMLMMSVASINLHMRLQALDCYWHLCTAPDDFTDAHFICWLLMQLLLLLLLLVLVLNHHQFKHIGCWQNNSTNICSTDLC